MSPDKSLHAMQQAFLNAVIDDTQFAGLIGNSDDAELVSVHRNNWRSNLTNALRATYPVIERLVGVDFFGYTASCFIDAHPSRSANLEDYGAEFAEFLRAFPAAQSLPYLADVAVLEAAIEAALVADEGVAYAVSSPFPILRIWQVNQPGWEGDEQVDLDTGANYLCVHRIDDDVLIEPIAADNFATQQLNG